MPFYRPPIDPGYSALGAALGGGLSAGVGNFIGQRQRREDQEIQRQQHEAILAEREAARQAREQELLFRQQQAQAAESQAALERALSGVGPPPEGPVPVPPGVDPETAQFLQTPVPIPGYEDVYVPGRNQELIQQILEDRAAVERERGEAEARAGVSRQDNLVREALRAGVDPAPFLEEQGFAPEGMSAIARAIAEQDAADRAIRRQNSMPRQTATERRDDARTQAVNEIMRNIGTRTPPREALRGAVMAASETFGVPPEDIFDALGDMGATSRTPSASSTRDPVTDVYESIAKNTNLDRQLQDLSSMERPAADDERAVERYKQEIADVGRAVLAIVRQVTSDPAEQRALVRRILVENGVPEAAL